MDQRPDRSAGPNGGEPSAESLLRLQRDVALVLGSAATLHEGLSGVLRLACAAEGIDGGGVYLVDEGRQALDLFVHLGLPDWFVAEVSHFGSESLQWKLTRAGKPAYGIAREYDPATLQLQEEQRLKGLAVLPVLHAGQVVAVLNLASRTYDTIPAATCLALETIAAQIGAGVARARAEEALRRSQQDLRALFDGMADLVWVVGPDRRILFTNAAARARLRYTEAELVGMPALDVHPPGRRDEAATVLARMQLGLEQVCTVPLIMKTGEEIPVETRVVQGVWGGQPVLVGVSRDISELKWAQEELRRVNRALEQRVADRTHELEERNGQLYTEMSMRARSGTFFRRVVESSVFGILWGRTDGSVVYANDAFLGLLGFSREDLEDGVLNWIRLTPPEYRAGDGQVAGEAMTTGASGPYEKEFFRKDGSRVPVLVGGVYVDEERSEGVIFALGLADLKRAEAALRRSQDEVRALTENSPDIVDRFDRQYVHLYVNSAGLRLLGRPVGEVIGKTIRQTGLPEPWCSKWEERIGRTFETRQPSEVEDEFPSADGLRAYQSRLVPEFAEDGTVRTVLAVSRDITERRRIEEALRRAREGLEQQVKDRTAQLRALTAELTRVEQRERRRIAAILHEDLLQTLAYMKIQLESLQRGATVEPQRQTAGKALDALRLSIRVARSLTLDLHPPVLYELGLGPALEWLAEEMQQRFGLAVRVEVDPAGEPASDDLRSFLFQAARELLFNVAKHSGVLEAALRMAPGAGGVTTVVEIRDDGAGFDPARRITGSYGLFSIRERAAHFGGELSIESAVGKGTRVTVSAPRG